MAIRPSIVIDTNVLVAGFRSDRGASYQLLSRIDSGLFEICLSVPLVCEYEEVLKRLEASFRVSAAEIDVYLDVMCRLGRQALICFSVEPDGADPDDRIVLEAAIAGGAETIVTYNKRHFTRAGEHGIRVMTPQEFLRELNVLP